MLVADAGLGTIDAVRSGVDSLGGRTTVVLLNRFEVANDLHRRNRDWLRDRDAIRVVTDIAALAAALPR